MKRILWTLGVIAMAAISCTKQENVDEGEIIPPSNGQETAKTLLRINSVSVGQTGDGMSKAAIKETSFPADQDVTIGVFLDGEGYESYKNVMFTRSAGRTSWKLDPQIELTDQKATVYAYYPYDSNISDIAQIPVASSVGGNDWLWTTPVGDVSKAKSSIDLKFNHSLALVEITFNVLGPTEGTMTNVTVAGGEGVFSKAGTMDATNGGTLTPDAGQMATTKSPFSQDVNLPLIGGKIVADCLLVPCKTGTDADARQAFYIKCDFNGKTYSASLTGDKGVIVRKNTKSTIVLNIKDNKLEVVSVGVAPWTDSNVSGHTATIGGHTVTFYCPAGLKYELLTVAESAAVPGKTIQGGEVSTVLFRYDKSSFSDYRFVFNNGSVSGCTFTHDERNGIITVKDVTDNVTVNLGFGTYIKYTATEKVIPNKTDAFGSPYDAVRSTFDESEGSGVVAIDGEIVTLGEEAFRYITLLTGVDLSGCKELKTIKKNAFDGCTHLTSVKLPEGLETIENNAFWHMGFDVSDETAWEPLILPSSITGIWDFAFEASRITSVTLPATLKTVGTDVFKYSTIKTLTIEDGAVLGKKMFNSCFQLTTVTCKSTTPPNMIADGLYAIANESDNTALTNIQHIYVPSSSVDAYKAASGWEMYSDKISAIPAQN